MSTSQEINMCVVCYDQKVCVQLSCCYQPLCNDCLEQINTQTCVYCRQTNTQDYMYDPTSDPDLLLVDEDEEDEEDEEDRVSRVCSEEDNIERIQECLDNITISEFESYLKMIVFEIAIKNNITAMECVWENAKHNHLELESFFKLGVSVCRYHGHTIMKKWLQEKHKNTCQDCYKEKKSDPLTCCSKRLCKDCKNKLTVTCKYCGTDNYSIYWEKTLQIN